MSDRYAANIEIGGQISRSKPDPDDSEQTCLEAFIAAINNESVSIDYGDKDENPANEQELLELLKEGENLQQPFATSEGHLCFKHSEIRNGEFEDLETACRRLGLSFNRHSEAYCEYDAHNTWWRPGMEATGETAATGSGNPLVTLDEVKKIREAAVLPEMPPGAAEHPFYCDDIETGIRLKITRMLDALIKGCEAPELPKFEIVD